MELKKEGDGIQMRKKSKRVIFIEHEIDYLTHTPNSLFLVILRL